MSIRGIIAGLMLLSSIAFAQTSFDQHFDLAKNGKLVLRGSNSAADCGVTRSKARITCGRSLDEGWAFTRVSSVGHIRDIAKISQKDT